MPPPLVLQIVRYAEVGEDEDAQPQRVSAEGPILHSDRDDCQLHKAHKGIVDVVAAAAARPSVRHRGWRGTGADVPPLGAVVRYR